MTTITSPFCRQTSTMSLAFHQVVLSTVPLYKWPSIRTLPSSKSVKVYWSRRQPLVSIPSRSSTLSNLTATEISRDISQCSLPQTTPRVSDSNHLIMMAVSRTSWCSNNNSRSDEVYLQLKIVFPRRQIITKTNRDSSRGSWLCQTLRQLLIWATKRFNLTLLRQLQQTTPPLWCR